jgi:hypothetical protein
LPRTGRSSICISSYISANRRIMPAFFIASCRAAPGGISHALWNASAALACNSGFGPISWPSSRGAQDRTAGRLERLERQN